MSWVLPLFLAVSAVLTPQRAAVAFFLRYVYVVRFLSPWETGGCCVAGCQQRVLEHGFGAVSLGVSPPQYLWLGLQAAAVSYTGALLMGDGCRQDRVEVSLLYPV